MLEELEELECWNVGMLECWNSTFYFPLSTFRFPTFPLSTFRFPTFPLSTFPLSTFSKNKASPHRQVNSVI
jgi:hypothetical protein